MAWPARASGANNRARSSGSIDGAFCPGVAEPAGNLAPDRRVDDPRMNRVDADAVAVGGAFHGDCLRKHPHPAFGGAIAGKEGRAAQARQRRHHDDGAALGLAHRRQAMLHRQKHAVEINRGLPPPVLQRHLCDRRRPNANAGVGHQRVEPAVALHHLGHDLDPAWLAGDVVVQEGRLATGFLDPRDHLRAPEFVDIGHGDGCAFLRQQLRTRLADAGCTAGDDRDFSLNLTGHFCSHFLLLVVVSVYLITAGPWSGTATSITRNCTRSEPW